MGEAGTVQTIPGTREAKKVFLGKPERGRPGNNTRKEKWIEINGCQGFWRTVGPTKKKQKPSCWKSETLPPPPNQKNI